jgi:enterochelin esterase-like enzyme
LPLCSGCVVSGGASVAVAQGKDEFTIGTTRTIESKVLKENRKLLIYLPESYERSPGYRRYPVLYMRDGGKFLQGFVVDPFAAGVHWKRG